MFRWTIVPEDDRYPNILVGAESTKCSGGQLFLKMTSTPISLWVQRLQSVQVDSCTWRWPLPQYPHGCREYKVFRWTAVPEDDHYPNILVGAKSTKCLGGQLYLKMTATPISSWEQRIQSVQVNNSTWRWPLPQYPRECRDTAETPCLCSENYVIFKIILSGQKCWGIFILHCISLYSLFNMRGCCLARSHLSAKLPSPLTDFREPASAWIGSFSVFKRKTRFFSRGLATTDLNGRISIRCMAATLGFLTEAKLQM